MDPEIIFWAGIWKWILVVGSGAFGVLMLCVTVFGAMDIKKLFATLREQQGDESQSES